MILYRTPSLDDLTYHYVGTPDTTVRIFLNDLDGRSKFFAEGTTDSNGYLDIYLRQLSAYDRNVLMIITDVNNNILLEENLEIVRPYIDPVGVTDLEEFKIRERTIRAIIDSITGGFYFRRKVITYDALGGDVLPLESGIVRIVRAWQNNVRVFDVSDPLFTNAVNFTISRDRTTIMLDAGELYANRLYGNDTALPWAPSDYQNDGYTGYGWKDDTGYYPMALRRYRPGTFMSGADYEFDVEYGYRFLPSDIELAAKLLMNDASCVDDYLRRGIIEYDTDQYRIKYDRSVLSGTGNRQVDMILSKYAGFTLGGIRAGVM